jgi:hypothetical protein
MDDFAWNLSGPFSDATDELPLDTTWAFDMATVMDTFAFDYSDAIEPWGSDGTITAFDEVGNVPAVDPCSWPMHTPAFTDAVVAQQNIIEAFTDREVSQEQLVYDATVHGWLSNGGMSPMEISSLLDFHGIDAHARIGATVEDLMAELAQGHKVVVGEDVGAWRNQDHPLADFFHQSANRAIWIEDVDMSDPTDPQIRISHSGDPDGVGKVYLLSDFITSWQDAGFFYVATDNPSPDLHSKVGGFDADTGFFSELVDFLKDLFRDFLAHITIDVGLPLGSLRIGFSTPLSDMDEGQRDELFRKI